MMDDEGNLFFELPIRAIRQEPYRVMTDDGKRLFFECLVTEEQRDALIDALDCMWAYGTDGNPTVARVLNVLRESLGMEPGDYGL
jgi:hypothetical protein